MKKQNEDLRKYSRDYYARQKTIKHDPEKEWFTPQEFANKLTVSKRIILNAIKLGEVKATCYNKKVFRIHVSEVEKYKTGKCSDITSDATAILAAMMGLSDEVLRRYPLLAEAKREQIKILRELKPTKRKQP